MFLETLYSRRSDGKTVQTLKIEVEGNKYRTHVGILDGAIVISKWTIAKGKNIGKTNETSPETQAMNEAIARHQKKLAEKYSTDIKLIDSERMFQPMLAKDMADYDSELFDEDGNAKEELFIQPKLDGLACIATKDGLFSRNSKPFVACPHIVAALKPWFDKNPNLILQGELYNHSLKDNFNSIVSHVKKQKPTDEDLIESCKIEYHIYDMPSNLIQDYDFRLVGLIAFHLRDIHDYYTEHGVYNKEYPLRVVDTKNIKTREELTTEYEAYIEEGYEGAMLRRNKRYENKRSKNLLKVKEFKDGEFTILDIVEGTGNRSSIAGYMAFMNGTKAFKSNIKGDREFLRELLINKEKYIGCSATVKYFGITPDNSLRFPVVTKINRESYE